MLTHINYGQWSKGKKEIGKAEELFREAALLNPNNPIIWRSWAMMKKELNDFEGSEKLLRKGLHYRKNDKATQHSLAVLESMKGNYEQAINCSRISISAIQGLFKIGGITYMFLLQGLKIFENGEKVKKRETLGLPKANTKKHGNSLLED